jgi:hypothetical protein
LLFAVTGGKIIFMKNTILVTLFSLVLMFGVGNVSAQTSYVDTMKMATTYSVDGQYVDVKVKLVPEGRESTASFSLNWNPAVMVPTQIRIGADAPANSVLSVNSTNFQQGFLGVLVDSTNSFGLAKESEWVVVTFYFTQRGFSAVNYGDFPTQRNVSTSLGGLYQTTWLSTKVR